MSYNKIPKISLDEIPSMTGRIREILIKHGIVNVNILNIISTAKLIEIRIDADVALRLIEEAIKETKKHSPDYLMGEELIKYYEECDELTTSCRSLDTILEGGFETKKNC